MEKICTIAIAVWNKPDVTIQCLKSLVSCTDYPHKVLIVDNGSQDETQELLRKFCQGRENFQIKRFDENIGYLKAANLALQTADTPYVCLLNNDTILTAGWLRECISVLEAQNDIGMISPTTNEVTDKFKKIFLSGDIVNNKGKFIEVNSCLGSCFILRKEVIAKIGYFDPVYGNGYFEEVEYCLRAQEADFKSALALGAYIRHIGTVSFDTAPKERAELWHKNRDILESRWGKPKRMLVFLKSVHDKDVLTKASNYILEKCRHRAIVELCSRDDARWADGLHFNIRKRSSIAYNLLALCLMVALKKKAYDTVITDIHMPSILNRFYDFTGLEAFDADADPLRRSVHNGPDGL